MQLKPSRLLAILSLSTLAACQQPTPPQPEVIPDAPSLASQWQGQWTGPEGTLLDLEPRAGGVDITIHSLDGPDSYQGKEQADGIQFVRNGKTETIRAGDGEATGMKWLLDKQNCLVIRLGEGFCRD